jgi:hypothetical protein
MPAATGTPATWAGYVVECTAKMLLVVATGTQPKQTHNLDVLHDDIEKLRLVANNIVAKYGDPTRLAPTMHKVMSGSTTTGKRSCHWDPYFRYDGSRWNDFTTSDQYVREAEQARDVLDKMTLDGVI